MKKSLVLIWILTLLMPNIVFGSDVNISGDNYILIENNSGRILAESNSNLKMPMASTTKIMTAILAIENGNFEDDVEIKGREINIEGSSIYLKGGESIKLEDLIYGLMLRSGNDSALAIANHISGSEEEFVKLMNKKAKEIGALNTNFTNPHGLHNDNHYSTAYDLAIITRYAFSNQEFEEITKSKNYRTKSIREYNYFVNKNKTIWDYEGGDGVKIGYTMKAGRCLVASASRNNVRLIAVTLNDYDWFNNTYKLMDYGFENFELHPIYQKDQLITQIDIIKGKKEKVPLVSEKEFLYPLREDEKDKIKILLNKNDIIRAPVEKGDELGTIEVYLDGKLIKRENLVSKYDISKESFLKRIFNRFEKNLR